MRYGFVMSTGTPREFADAARLAEDSGWDAIFTWEAVLGQGAWVTLTAAAMVTERIRLGTMLTPLPRHPAVGPGRARRHPRPPLERARPARGGAWVR